MHFKNMKLSTIQTKCSNIALTSIKFVSFNKINSNQSLNFLTMRTIKKISVSILAVVMVVMTVILYSCAGEEFKSGKISVEGVTYVIDYMNREATAIGLSDMDNVPTDLYIKDHVVVYGEAYPVKAIGPKAFLDVNFSNLIIGRNVTKIGRSAFRYSDIDFIWVTGMTFPEATEDVFDASLYESSTLIVIEGAKLTRPWVNFKRVQTAYYL